MTPVRLEPGALRSRVKHSTTEPLRSHEELMCKNQQHQYPFLASGDFCHLLITFVNNLGPDQDQENVGPDLDPNHFDILMVFLKESFEKVNFEKSQQIKTKA